MKLRIWLVTRDRLTWFTAAEIVALAIVLLGGSDSVRLLFGLPLLAHLGYMALTSVPLGQIPGRPEWAKQVRRNQDLRSRVVGFLNEMRRVEDLAHHAHIGGRSPIAIEKDLITAKQRMMAAASEVVKAAGQLGPQVADATEASPPRPKPAKRVRAAAAQRAR
jgi:hypothetical protein